MVQSRVVWARRWAVPSARSGDRPLNVALTRASVLARMVSILAFGSSSACNVVCNAPRLTRSACTVANRTPSVLASSPVRLAMRSSVQRLTVKTSEATSATARTRNTRLSRPPAETLLREDAADCVVLIKGIRVNAIFRILVNQDALKKMKEQLPGEATLGAELSVFLLEVLSFSQRGAGASPGSSICATRLKLSIGPSPVGRSNTNTRS